MVLSRSSRCIDPNHVQPAKCRVCPFREGSDLAELQGPIIVKMLKGAMSDNDGEGGSHLCHEPSTRGKESEIICRGSRDIALQLFHRWGVLDAPTDEAWAAAVAKQSGGGGED